MKYIGGLGIGAALGTWLAAFFVKSYETKATLRKIAVAGVALFVIARIAG